MRRLGHCIHQQGMRARPLLAINSAIYWHALRESGITDRLAGFGPLLARY